MAATITDARGMKKVAVSTRRQFGVCVCDGTTHVFEEAIPRTLRVRDRIKGIAEAAATNG